MVREPLKDAIESRDRAPFTGAVSQISEEFRRSAARKPICQRDKPVAWEYAQASVIRDSIIILGKCQGGGNCQAKIWLFPHPLRSGVSIGKFQCMTTDDLVRLIEAHCGTKGISEAKLSEAVAGHGSVVADIRRNRVPGVARRKKICDIIDLEFHIGPPRSGEFTPQVGTGDLVPELARIRGAR